MWEAGGDCLVRARRRVGQPATRSPADDGAVGTQPAECRPTGDLGESAGFVSPQIFGFSLATSVVLWTLVGGRGTIVGPVIGAMSLNFASATLADVWLLRPSC